MIFLICGIIYLISSIVFYIHDFSQKRWLGYSLYSLGLVSGAIGFFNSSITIGEFYQASVNLELLSASIILINMVMMLSYGFGKDNRSTLFITLSINASLFLSQLKMFYIGYVFLDILFSLAVARAFLKNEKSLQFFKNNISLSIIYILSFSFQSQTNMQSWMLVIFFVLKSMLWIKTISENNNLYNLKLGFFVYAISTLMLISQYTSDSSVYLHSQTFFLFISLLKALSLVREESLESLFSKTTNVLIPFAVAFSYRFGLEILVFYLCIVEINQLFDSNLEHKEQEVGFNKLTALIAYLFVNPLLLIFTVPTYLLERANSFFVWSSVLVITIIFSFVFQRICTQEKVSKNPIFNSKFDLENFFDKMQIYKALSITLFIVVFSFLFSMLVKNDVGYFAYSESSALVISFTIIIFLMMGIYAYVFYKVSDYTLLSSVNDIIRTILNKFDFYLSPLTKITQFNLYRDRKTSSITSFKYREIDIMDSFQLSVRKLEIKKFESVIVLNLVFVCVLFLLFYSGFRLN